MRRENSAAVLLACRAAARILLFAAVLFPVSADHRENAADFMPSAEQRRCKSRQEAERQRPLRPSPGKTPAAEVKSGHKIAADQQGCACNAAEYDDVVQR